LLQVAPDYDLFVSGNLNPDATGAYYAFGEYDGETSYANEALTFFIWFSAIDGWWQISTEAGIPGDAYWQRQDSAVTGEYPPLGASTGTATVTLP
jgi:hypothetical protein